MINLNTFFKIKNESTNEIFNVKALLNFTLTLTTLAGLSIFILSVVSKWTVTPYLLAFVTLVSILGLIINQFGKTEIAAFINVIILLFMVFTSSILGQYGIHDLSVFVFPIVIILISIFFDKVKFWLMLLLSLLVLYAIAIICYYDPDIYVVKEDLISEATLIAIVLIVQAVLLNIIISKFSKNVRSIQENEQKYKSIFENLTDIYMELNSKGMITEISPSVEELTGKNKDYFLNNYIDILFKKDMTAEEIYNKLSNNEKVDNIEMLLKSDDLNITLLANYDLRNDHTGNTILLASLRDITEKKKLENQLIHSQKMEALGTLAGGIAHDFNNILGGLYGYIQVLELMYKENKKTNHYLSEMMKASKRAKELIDQILTFSKNKEYEKQTINITVILKEAVKLLRASIPKYITISLNINKDLLKINANPTQIHQIIMNLGTNAYHAIEPNKGKITIEAKNIFINSYDSGLKTKLVPGEYIEIKFTDDGCGIDKEVMPRIFEPYFSTKPKNKGNGLGLSTVHGIVRSHNGYIDVYSKSEVGTTFTLLFPAQKSNTIENERNVYQMNGNSKILFIDDEEFIANTYKEILDSFGYQVSSFTNPKEALKEFDNNSNYDILITDMNMPDINGLEVIEYVRQKNKDIFIILSTGYSNNINESITRQFNINKILNKPILVDDLLGVLNEIN